MRLPGGLRARITLAAVAAVALGGVVAGSLLVAAVARDGRQAVDRELRQRAGGVLRDGGGPRGPGGPFGGGRRFGGDGPPGGPPDPLLAGSGSFTQVAVNGTVVARRGDVPASPPAVPSSDGLTTVAIDGEDWRSLTVSSPRGDLRLQVLSTLEPAQARAARIRRLVLVIGLLAIAIVGLAAWALTTLATRPLAVLRDRAARVSRTDDLLAPLPEDEGPDEVRSLARALNEMLARIRTSTEATRRFAADAGHELRTPLTGLRANLDALARNPDLPVDEREQLLRETTAEQERMVHLLEGLQALARGDAASALPREDLDVGDVVDAAVYAARRRHPDTTLTLEVAEGAGVTVRGWPGGLRLIADNLLDNAARHGGAHVHASVRREGDSVLLRVDDDGRGIPAADRDRLLEPFTRGADATAPGSGLGLAIVAQQAGLHDGELTLGEGELGGLRAEVRFPALSARPLRREHEVVEDRRR